MPTKAEYRRPHWVASDVDRRALVAIAERFGIPVGLPGRDGEPRIVRSLEEYRQLTGSGVVR